MDVSAQALTDSFDLNFCHAYGTPALQGLFRTRLEDFIVTEEFPGERLTSDGEHHCFWIEKRGQNTRWVAKLLAEYFEVPEVAIGYCGLKDRHAITRQWFSVHLPGQQAVAIPDLGAGVNVLAHGKSTKKLRRGDHAGNRFSVRLRDLSTDSPDGMDQLITKLEAIKQRGVPNYFGEQRFGLQGNNLKEADRLLTEIRERKPNSRGKNRGRGRQSPQKGLYLSAARSYLFNRVLSGRIERDGWQSIGQQATGPLWGRGLARVSEELRRQELELLKDWQHWLLPLEFSGLTQERRPLILYPREMDYVFEGRDLRLDFQLAPGQFATSVLREIARLLTPLQTPETVAL